MLAQGTFQFIHADVFLGHVRSHDLPIVHQKGRLPLDEFAEAAIAAGNLGNEIVQYQQRSSAR